MKSGKQAAMESGKAAILDHWRELLARYGIETSVVFAWTKDDQKGQWTLTTRCGKLRYDIEFQARDVASWTTKPEVAGTYYSVFLNTIDFLKQDCH